MAPFPVAHEVVYLLVESECFDGFQTVCVVGKQIIEIAMYSQADNSGSELHIRSELLQYHPAAVDKLSRSEWWLAQHQDSESGTS
jgi:hypothetical protein